MKYNINMEVTLEEFFGKETGDFIYSVIINNTDFSEYESRIYCGDSEDEVGDMIVGEKGVDICFKIKLCGERGILH